MKKTTVIAGAVGTVALASIARFLWTFTSSPMERPVPLPDSVPIPEANPPDGMEIIALPTGVNHRSAAAAYRGGSFFDKRDFAMTATLIKHPQGDLLVDTGFGRTIRKQYQEMPFWFRLVTNPSYGKPAIDQLEESGYDLASLRSIFLTHGHWDHVSGLPDFPGKPVYLTRRELEFVHEKGHGQLTMEGINWQVYDFDGGPYLGFPRSHDVYGDGSIVCVPAPGHTPGGVVIFVTLPKNVRYALIGDLVWQREGLRKLEERPWFFRSVADIDPEGTRENMLRIRAIQERIPWLILVPAHDQRGFAEMSRLPVGKGQATVPSLLPLTEE